MQTVLLDKNNNLIISNGSMQIIDGIEACAQDTKTRVGLCIGENPLNTTEGIDYFNDILGKLGGLDYIREAIRKRILDNSEIVQIEKLSVNAAGGVVEAVAEISSIYGVFEI